MAEHRTLLHRVYTLVKRILPAPVSGFFRSFFTALGTPIFFSLRSGHFKSSFKRMSVTATGDFLPWYTYPMIDFLRMRDFSRKIVLEFGAGQSTLWWSQHASRVVSMEDNKEWYELLKSKIPANVELHLVSGASGPEAVKDVESLLQKGNTNLFDVIIIDGLFRTEMIPIAVRMLKEEGILICDNAEGYRFYESLQSSEFSRIDFFGHAPGVMLPHCTALYFKNKTFVLNPDIPIPMTTA